MGCAESQETVTMDVTDTELGPGWFRGEHFNGTGTASEEARERAKAGAAVSKKQAEAKAAAAVAEQEKAQAEAAAAVAEKEKAEAAVAVAAAVAAEATLAAAKKEGDKAKIAEAAAAAVQAAENAEKEKAEAKAAQNAAAVEAAEAAAAAAAAIKEKAEADAAAAAEKAEIEAANAERVSEFAAYDPQRLAELRKVFDAFDLDGNGLVELGELTCVGQSLHSGKEWSTEQAKKRFASFDTDTDGEISFPEYAHFYKDVFSSNMSDEQFMRGCDDMLQSALKARAQCDSSQAQSAEEPVWGEVMLRAIAQDNEEDLLAALDLPGVDIKEGIVESDVEDRDTSDWYVTFGGAKITYKQIGRRYDDMELVDGDTPMEIANRNKKFKTNKILHAKKKELNAAAAAAAAEE